MLNGLAWFFYVIGCVMFSLIIVPLKLLEGGLPSFWVFEK